MVVVVTSSSFITTLFIAPFQLYVSVSISLLVVFLYIIIMFIDFSFPILLDHQSMEPPKLQSREVYKNTKFHLDFGIWILIHNVCYLFCFNHEANFTLFFSCVFFYRGGRLIDEIFSAIWINFFIILPSNKDFYLTRRKGNVLIFLGISAFALGTYGTMGKKKKKIKSGECGLMNSLDDGLIDDHQFPFFFFRILHASKR